MTKSGLLVHLFIAATLAPAGWFKGHFHVTVAYLCDGYCIPGVSHVEGDFQISHVSCESSNVKLFKYNDKIHTTPCVFILFKTLRLALLLIVQICKEILKQLIEVFFTNIRH